MTEEERVARRESSLFCALMFCRAVEPERLRNVLNLSKDDIEEVIKYREHMEQV
ncbi:hypothetical protein [Clostridium sp.]|uniref:hypothetical protein n=1 Tax=Clostridium sp. TaxID=1506 RepID=UPI00284CB216|nr:hypothetical protein [Clostridium sp.]MDR3598718.1 hypothetical protein [Clostridium sp.]